MSPASESAYRSRAIRPHPPAPARASVWVIEARAFVAAAAILIATTARLPAQVVTGTVVEQTGATPVRGAFVRLVDDAGEFRGGVLTDSAGGFVLRAARPGRYTLLVDQIGYATSATAALDLPEGATLRQDVELEVRAVALDGVAAVARSRCGVRPESGAETHRLWSEARKALDVVAWRTGSSVLRYDIATFRHQLDASGRPVRNARPDTSSVTGPRPFDTLAPADLVENGFIRAGAAVGAYDFLAPDAQVLLSDAFQSTHCFWVERPRSGRRTGLVGLAFEPVRGRRTSDIRGVLWLDALTAELRALDFAYTRLPWGLADGLATGNVEFRRTPAREWIMDSWTIRIPRVEYASGARGSADGRDRYQLVGFDEGGGSVRRLMTTRGIVLHDAGRPIAGPEPALAPEREPAPAPAREPVRPEPVTAVLNGRVEDAATGTPIAGAVARIAGQPGELVSDSAGAFVIRSIDAGTHAFEIVHLGYVTLVDSVDVPAGTAVNLRLRLTPEAIPLTPVEAEGVSEPGGRLAAVHNRVRERTKMGLGQFIRREDIERRPVSRLTDLLREIRGLELIRYPPWMYPGHYMVVNSRAGILRTECKVHLFVDGTRLTTANRPAQDDPPFDTVVPVNAIEIVEIYLGHAQVPPELADGRFPCGVVAVWTR